MFFYLDRVLSTIAAHCEVGEDEEEVTAAKLLALSAGLAEARLADPICVAPMTVAVNLTKIAKELRVASGAKSEVDHSGDGGQVVVDILARAGVPAGLFVPLKRVQGVRAQRRGARTLIMADGRKERAPRAVTRKVAAEELAKLKESGVLDVGREFPPRVYIELEKDDGEKTTKPLGAFGRVLNLQERVTRRVNAMMDDWLVAWRPAFESMDEQKISKQLARHGLKPLEKPKERKGKAIGKEHDKENEGGNDKKEESLDGARTRLRAAWLWAMSDRSKPAQDGGKCSVSCDQCEVVECCSASECGKSRAIWACACAQSSVLRCVRCARLGRASKPDVREALRALGEEMPPTWSEQKCLDRLVQLERMHHVTQRLVQLGEPAWLPEEGVGPHSPVDLYDEAREARVLKAQMAVGIRIALWADGSPMLNKPWQLCTWHLLYDPLLFVHGTKAERECRRPEVFFLMQAGDGLEDIKYQCGVRLEELHPLNEPLEFDGGLRTKVSVRFLEGDNPELQKQCGVCSGGGAEQSCCRCKAMRKEHTDLVKSARAQLRSLNEAVELAAKAAKAGDAYQMRFGPSVGTADELFKLAYVLGVEGGAERTRKLNEPKVRAKCEGYNTMPALLGSNSNALKEVHAIIDAEAMPDYPLHALKGLLALIFETIESTLTPAERAKFEKNLDHLHNGATIYSGMHRRLQLASVPKLLGEFELGELREAMDCLAQAMVWGIRVTHARWHTQRHFCVVRTAVLMHKFAVLLTRNIPALKMTKNGEKPRTLYGLFFHQLTAHLVSDLKRVCPMHVMCEWMEMWWGPLRRLTLATSSKDAKHATLNMITRMPMRELFCNELGARASYAEPSHSDHGPIGDAYLKHYGACDGERLELDERFLGPELEALLRQIPEYLELGEGTWYSVTKREQSDVLIFHVGSSDPDHALPAPQHFRSHSAKDGKNLEDKAFEAMVRIPGNLFHRFCTTSATPPPSLWADVLRRAQPDAEPIEPDTDDEEDEFEFEDEATTSSPLEDEADALAGDEGEVDVAPAGPIAPLRVLDIDQLSGVWSDASGAPLAKTIEGNGEAFLRANGRTLAMFKGTLKRGEPDGHGRLEMKSSGDGWRGEMVNGEVGGHGEAWDEAGNTFVGSTSSPRWLLDEAASAVRRAAAAARKSNAPFDAKTIGVEINRMHMPALRAALVANGESEKLTSARKPELVARLLEVQRQAHLAMQQGDASSEDPMIPEWGYAGTVTWATGSEEHGLFEELTFKLLHTTTMNVAMKNATAKAIALAEEAADAVRAAEPMEVEETGALDATPVDEQSLALLGPEFPKEDRESLLDRWSGVSTEGVFANSVLVHVLARAASGRVMGFLKAFLMTRQAGVSEVYLDEALVGEADRGQRLLQHMVTALIDACKAAGSRVTRVRGQCKRGEKMVGDRSVNLHEHVYTPMALGTEYAAPASEASPWRGTGPDDPSYIMWYGQGAAVREAAAALARGKPLGQGVSVSVHLGGWGNGAAAAAASDDASAAASVAASDVASDDAAMPDATTSNDATMPNAAASDVPRAARAAAHVACSERRLLPPDSPHASPGGLLEQLEALEATAVTTRLQGTARMRLSQARDRALLAVAHHAIQARESGASTGGSEAEADLYTRQLSFLVARGIGPSALAATLARNASRMLKTRDAYVCFLLSDAADLIEDLRRGARLTSCAPRIAVRESEVNVTGSWGERLLGGTERARAAVLGSELDQSIRREKRLEADLQKQKARSADLKAKKEATERLAREAAGEAAGAAAESAAQQPGPSAAHAQAAPKRRRV